MQTGPEKHPKINSLDGGGMGAEVHLVAVGEKNLELAGVTLNSCC
jgi:hypothetical protein